MDTHGFWNVVGLGFVGVCVLWAYGAATNGDWEASALVAAATVLAALIAAGRRR